MEKQKKKKTSLKKKLKHINWTRTLALFLVIVLLASFISTLLFSANAAK